MIELRWLRRDTFLGQDRVLQYRTKYMKTQYDEYGVAWQEPSYTKWTDVLEHDETESDNQGED
jgi:hypothetical protein